MRLIKPTPGECIDRQTILELKIKYGSQGATDGMMMETTDSEEKGLMRIKMDSPSKVNIEPFLEENEQIQRYLEKDWFPDLPSVKGEELDKLLEALSEVNEQLWKLMDQAYILKDAPDKMQEMANQRAAEVLFAIVEGNSKRAGLVQKLNALWNIRVQEKLYA